MRNFEVAFIFNDIADMLEIKGENFFKIRAYRKAARTIENLPVEIEEMAKEGRLQEIEGIGKALSDKIYEILETGTCHYYENLKKEIPPGLVEMLKIPGLGAKKIKVIHDTLGISSIEELEKAARTKKLRTVPGIGTKTELSILKGVEALKNRAGRVLLATALLVADQVVSSLSSMKEVTDAEVVGSLRRKKEMVGDIDIIAATATPETVLNDFSKIPHISEITERGATTVSAIHDMGAKIDLILVTPQEFYPALRFFTGSVDHNTELQSLAQTMGYDLDETKILNKNINEIFYPESEIQIYEKLGLPYIIPELREGRGEIKAARCGKLPEVVELEDIKGDLHIHSNFSDGISSIKEIAKKAKSLGYEYIAITDHSKSLKIAGGIDEEKLKEQIAAIKEINKKSDEVYILTGIEVDILSDGTLDFSDDVLSKLDIVIASIHSGFKQDTDTITNRIITACQNPHVDIIAHPTGRILGRRDPYAADMDKILEAAAATNTVLEINSSPDRLDLNDLMAQKAKEMGIKMVIDTDAHDKEALEDIKYGVWTARRGWLEEKDIANTMPLDELLKFFKVKK